jgi:hypothetical protein
MNGLALHQYLGPTPLLLLNYRLLCGGGLLFLLFGGIGLDFLLCRLLLRGLRGFVAHNQFVFSFFWLTLPRHLSLRHRIRLNLR